MWNKSKVCVFRKGTRVPKARWLFDDVTLNVVNKIHYFGIILTSYGILTVTQKVLAEQAGRAVLLLCQRLSKFINITLKITIDLFCCFFYLITPAKCGVFIKPMI